MLVPQLEIHIPELEIVVPELEIPYSNRGKKDFPYE